MIPRLQELAEAYSRLKIAVIGDFCLDRYLDIDPSLSEVSIETGRQVYNVVRVRAQPGAAGTVVNNLVALGIGTILTVGAVGDDGEGYELLKALGRLRGVRSELILRAEGWRTFTYCKPMLFSSRTSLEAYPTSDGPTELDRLDSKNWSRLPAQAERELVASIRALEVDAIVVMDQVDVADTGVVTRPVREAVAEVAARRCIPVIADSRRGLGDYPPLLFKMNAVELGRFFADEPVNEQNGIARLAVQLAARNRQPVVVTLSERGILAADPGGAVYHAPALPVRGSIDVVGAGDCVTANLIAALASKASLPEALTLAMAAASIVVHQLGTTGTASLEQISGIIDGEPGA